ncbi:flavin reductase family protein [Streptomyces sp. NPDC012769]|uniref:flavin reductase family protein n=1 Tax=Streptomyces sp. NPDC012769 TaxID=3364848 RepID=UPI0036B2EB6C
MRFRHLAGRYPTGVTVVSTMTGGGPHGTTVNSFTTVSLDPLSVLVCLKRGGRLLDQLEVTRRFCVSLLGEDQADLARWFAGPGRTRGEDSFAGVPWQPSPATGSPVLTGALGYFDCEVAKIVTEGAHDIVVGRVVDFAPLTDGPPLLFWRSRLGSADIFRKGADPS